MDGATPDARIPSPLEVWDSVNVKVWDYLNAATSSCWIT
jgi:hypothetical protein